MRLMMFFFLLVVAVVSSITIEGKWTFFRSMELKWKMEVLGLMNYIAIILQVDSSALGVGP